MLKKGAKNKRTTGGLINEENVSGSDLEDGSIAGLAEAGNTDNTDNMENPSTMDIMKAMQSFKQDFHTEMDDVLATIKNVQSDIKECSGCIAEAEL